MSGFPNTNDYAKALQDLVDEQGERIQLDGVEEMKEPKESNRGIHETHRGNIWLGKEDSAKRQAAQVKVFGNS